MGQRNREDPSSSYELGEVVFNWKRELYLEEHLYAHCEGDEEKVNQNGPADSNLQEILHLKCPSGSWPTFDYALRLLPFWPLKK